MNIVRRLTSYFTPIHYTLNLDVSARTERVFRGAVTLTGNLLAASDTIILHAKELSIKSAHVGNMQAMVTQGDNDELLLTVPHMLPAAQHDVHIVFSGVITDAMHGLYPGYYKENGQDKEMLVTQLESHSAREVFPCIDEPEAKAVFSITLTTELDKTVLGNMPVAAQHTAHGKLITRFDPTPRMSTYLVAFTVGELEFIETTSEHGVIVRAYATRQNIAHATFALDLAAKTLDFLDDFFAQPFPLPKCDLVCVPDFSALAMENWGLIVFRENGLLVDEANSSASSRHLVAEVVIHELAHQWFGNLVTMQWWNDLWLNESFAKWMEFYGVNHMFPEWRSWEFFKGSEQNIAFNRDSLQHVQAVRQPVAHPDELHSLFDPAIVYAKGSALILMLQDFVGEEHFQRGLQTYIAKHKYGNASADDLWDALSQVSGKDVKTMMTPWLTQSGHPVVSVTINENGATLMQQQFFSNPDAPKNTKLWPIPLLQESHTATTTFTQKELPLAAWQDNSRLNVNGDGFFHTHYPSAHLSRLLKDVQSGKLDAQSCQNLLNDVVHLCRGGYYDATVLLNFITACRQQTSFAVWQAANAGFEALRHICDGDDAATVRLQHAIGAAASEQYQRLGWKTHPQETHFDRLLRPLIINMMTFAGDNQAIASATDICASATSAADLPGDLRSLIIGVAIQEKGLPAFETFLTWYKVASAEERTHLCTGFAAATDPAIAHRAIELFTDKTVKPQDLRHWYAPMMRNHHLRPIIWQWIIDSWAWIEAEFKNGHEYGDFAKYTAMGMTTHHELTEYKKFFASKATESDLSRLIAQGIDDITARAAWRTRDLPVIHHYDTTQ